MAVSGVGPLSPGYLVISYGHSVSPRYREETQRDCLVTAPSPTPSSALPTPLLSTYRPTEFITPPGLEFRTPSLRMCVCLLPWETLLPHLYTLLGQVLRKSLCNTLLRALKQTVFTVEHLKAGFKSCFYTYLISTYVTSMRFSFHAMKRG